MKIRSVALATLFFSLLPATLFANHAVKVGDKQWHLIGITGYYEIAGASATTTVPNLKDMGQGVIDFADDFNNISWDRNISHSEMNKNPNMANNFADAANDAPAITNSPDGGQDRLGLPFHSVVGLRAIKMNGSGLVKAVLAYNAPTAPSATTGKDYGAPMRTMYLVSPLSQGDPDVMIIYSAQLENQEFKISFKDQNSTWNFQGDAADKVYKGTFHRSRTFDNPISVLKGGLSIVQKITQQSTTKSNGYKSLTNTIDANIANNAPAFGPLTTANFEAFDGSATIYKYNPKASIWAIATIDGKGGTGAEELTSPAEVGSPGASNRNFTNIKGDFSTWEKGYGYWVKLDSRNPNPDMGILANTQIGSPDDYNGTLNTGWNLLAFPDSSLRHTASGFVIPNALTGITVVDGFGEGNMTVAAAFNKVACTQFNADVVALANNSAKNNRLDVRCLWNGTDPILISDKPFYIYKANNPNDPEGIQSLAGYGYTADDMINFNESASPGDRRALRSRLGEYAVLVQRNPDFRAAVVNANTLTVGLPSWFNIAPSTSDALATIVDINRSFHDYMNAAAVPTPSYDTEKRAAARRIDSNITGSADDDMYLLAANNRFYVRDNTFIRLFDTMDTNGSILNIKFDGVSHETNATKWIAANGTKLCTDINASVDAATNQAVNTVCLRQGTAQADGNRTVMFVSDSKLNFDVREVDTKVALLIDRHIGSTRDHNDSVYGAIKAVYQPSEIARTLVSTVAANGGETIFGGSAVSNLTYSAVWAEDFPNNGAIYYMTGNGYKPEMFLTAVTGDGNSFGAINPAGTISWKALDVTRNPVDWFNGANDFELLWTEKERGYWVYLADGYSNPVTVGGVQTTTSSVVNKHFHNIIENEEGEVFNWFDGYLDARVGGLVRSGYTSGQSYVVNAVVGGGKMSMATTGAVSAGVATFATYLSDFEVPGYRPTGVHEAVVSASDGLGGRAEGNTTIKYVKPATPTVAFEAKALKVTSNEVATDVVIYDGNITDELPMHVYTGTIETPVDLTAVTAIKYPGQQLPLITTDAVPEIGVALGNIIRDLRVIAATAAPSNKLSVYSNMRSVRYLPIYSGAAHMTVDGENNATNPTALYNVTLGTEADQFGVAYRGENGSKTTLVFMPLVKNNITGGAPIHANLNFGGKVTQLQFLKAYEGQVFYVYDHSTSKWYYGVFPAQGFAYPYTLTLKEAVGVKQGLE